MNIFEYTQRKSFPIDPSTFLYFAFALVYASILTSLPIDAFKDRANYITYAEASINILNRYRSIGFITAFFNEPLWLWANIILSKSLEPPSIVRLFIFLPSFIISFLLLKHRRGHFLAVFLILLYPLVIKNHIIHLRQGVAIAVFLTGYYLPNRLPSMSVMFLASFFHTSFFVISVLGVISWWLQTTRASSSIRVLFLLISLSVISLIMIPLSVQLGARQGGTYAEAGLNISGVGFVFWMSILILYLSAGKAFSKDSLFSISILIFYLTTYFISPIAARILESGILITLVRGLDLPGWRRQIFIFAILIIAILTYSSQLSEPWLGWGEV